MKVRIQPSKGAGVVTAPPSKSMAHRLLLAAALSQEESVVANVALSQDISATIKGLKAMGVACTLTDQQVQISHPIQFHCDTVRTIHCQDSGSTLRFFIPLAFCCDQCLRFTGSKTLFSRPLWVYEQLCKKRGLIFKKEGTRLTVGGKLFPGEIHLPGNVSSQFVSGLLFILPLLSGESVIHLTNAVESRPYIDMTMGVLETFGVESFWQDERTILVPGGQQYHGGCYSVEGDYSNAAVFMGLKHLGHPIAIKGLSPESLQGDKVAEEYFMALSQPVAVVDLSQCPDLGPVLFAFSALKGGGGVFTHTRRLRMKESDRIASMVTELAKLNIRCIVEEDQVIIPRGQCLKKSPTPLDGHCDHRVVMALSMMLTTLGGEINGAETVAKSYPDFFDTMMALGYDVFKK